MFLFIKMPSVQLLLFQGIQYIVGNSMFVSHGGVDRDSCGNWTTPCRTVRHAVKMCTDGDEIYVDYAHGRPYMECENVTHSTCSIELRKSLSLQGLNGRAKLMCGKDCKFFTIKSPSFNRTRIQFSNLVVSGTNIAIELDKGSNAELAFRNMLLHDNNYVIHSKYSTDCSIWLTNSSFEKNDKHGNAIYLRCLNLTLQINFCKFELTPVYLTNPQKASTLWQKAKVLVQNSIFDGNGSEKCISMFTIQPFATELNVTVTDSEFKNHFAICKHPYQEMFSFNVLDRHSSPRKMTFVLLSNLLIENSHTKWSAVRLNLGYLYNTEVQVMIRDSIFKNNSMALGVSITSFNGQPFRKEKPTIIHQNNTFINNICHLVRPGAAPAIAFYDGKNLVNSCRFLDNGGTASLYTGVVTIFDTAKVTFNNSYFINRQSKVLSNQLFAIGNNPIRFIGKNTFNLVTLKKKQSVFIRIPTAMTTGVIMRKDFKILCPQGYKLETQQKCVRTKKTILCYYIDVQCDKCPAKTYTLERGEFIFNRSNDIQCQPCPKGGDCVSGQVTAKPNFWGYQSRRKIVFVQCPPGYCCDSDDCASYSSCFGKRVGALCGQCPGGMSESLISTKCISNKECSLNYFLILGTVAMLVVYLVFFLYHKEIIGILRMSLFSKRLPVFINSGNNVSTSGYGSVSSSSGMIKIFFYYYQVCHLLRNSVGSFKGVQFVEDFENGISRVMNMILGNFQSFNCPFPNLRPVPKIIILHSVGYVLLLLLCLLNYSGKLFLAFKRLRNANDGRVSLQDVTSTRSTRYNASTFSFSQRVASAFTYISLLMYASSTELCLSLLNCVPVNDKLVLLLDGNVKCYQEFQHFLLAYITSSILPFCLVPVLGSYLLKSGRIGVKQFYAACIFPLPFCSYWLYLLFKECRRGNLEGTYDKLEDNDGAIRPGTQSLTNEDENTSVPSDNNENTTGRTESAILRVLLGPFRLHQAFMCFPSSHIPWEGFLIFRRLLLIIVLTFTYDIQLRLFIASTLCVVFLIIHMFVNPFERKSDNVLESFSLAAHVVLCSLTLIKALYYGEENASFSKFFPALKVIEYTLTIAPISVIMIVVIVSIALKVMFGFKKCVAVAIRKVK